MPGYGIELRTDASWTAQTLAALTEAARFWMDVITAPLPPVDVDGERIDGLRITAAVVGGGAAGGALARAGPVGLRPGNAGAAAFLPATGELYLEQADVDQLAADERLTRVLIHEIGHILGIGSIWTLKGLLQGSGTANPQFVGARAMAEYGALRHSAPMPVPVENRGGQGVANRHWRETTFGEELLSSYLPTANNPLSRLTIASIEDLGYSVDYARAEAYQLGPPPHHALQHSLLQSPMWLPSYKVAPTIPEVMPETALIVE